MRKKLTNNLGLKLASLMLAIVLWFLVVQIEDPQDSASFTNVQVKLINTELLEQEGKVYEVLENTDIARVKVYAPRSIISQIRETDIVAEADVSKLTDINTIAINYYVENVAVDRVEGSRDVVRLSVEEEVRKWIRLIGNTVGEVAEGYMVYNSSLDQTNIEISGPQSAVSKVEYAAADMGVAGATTSLSANVDIKLYDSEGKEIIQNNIQKNVSSAYMTIEVLATKEVPVEVSSMGEPKEGYMATGVVECSMPSVTLAAKPSVLENISVIAIPEEKLDITGADADVEQMVDLDDYLPDNVRFADKMFNGKVSITAFVEPIVSKEIEVPVANIAFRNLPEGMEAEWSDDVENYSLTVSGLWEYINSVQPETITGYVDVAAYMEEKKLEELKEGEYIVPVTFNLTENITVDKQLNASIIFTIPDDGNEE